MISKKILKTSIAITCVTLLIVSHTSCSKSVTEIKNAKIQNDLNKTKDADISNMKDLSFYDSKTKCNISIGMTKEMVEKKLGMPSKDKFLGKYNYQGLAIFYRNNKVVAMTVSLSINITNRFKVINKIGLGSSKDDVIRVHNGDSIEGVEGIKGQFLTYYYENKNNTLLNANEIVKSEKANETIKGKKDTETKNIYYYSYIYAQKDIIDYISIGDYQYAFNSN